MGIDKAIVEAEANYPLVAVAIDKDKGSPNALKWAINHLVSRGQTLVLVHVNTKAPSGGQEDTTRFKLETDLAMKELFLPFRCFCFHKGIQCKEIVLDDKDIAKALIEFASQTGIEKFALGSPAKCSIMRRFKTTDVPSYVSKGAPDFCTVYIISGSSARSPSFSREEPYNRVGRNEKAKKTKMVFSPFKEEYFTFRNEETNMCISAAKETEEKKRNDIYGIKDAIIAFKALKEEGFTFEFDDLDKAITFFMSSIEIREVFLTLEPNDKALWIRRRIDRMSLE